MKWDTLKRASGSDMAVIESGWQEFKARIGQQFKRSRTRETAACYVQGLLGRAKRKNGWQLSEAAGHSNPDKIQYLLERAKWDADAARDELISYAHDKLESDDGVLILDETGFIKKGEHSVGVQRQYSGTAGRIENCQIGVFMAYASKHGRTLLDRALYLPKSWHDDEERCTRAGVPRQQCFATKPQLAITMLSRARDHGVNAQWVLGDEVYGNDSQLRQWCKQHEQPYVLAVSCQHRVWVGWRQVRVDAVLDEQPAGVWHTLSAGRGSKGDRKYEWSFWGGKAPRGWVTGILFRRSLSKKEVSYYEVLAKPDTQLAQLAAAAGRRWAIEECFQSAKGEVGLDEYEVRTWDAWHRHMTLAMWAHAFLTIQRMSLADTNKKKLRRRASRRLRPVVHPGDPTRVDLASVARAAQPRSSPTLVVVETLSSKDCSRLPLQEAAAEVVDLRL